MSATPKDLAVAQQLQRSMRLTMIRTPLRLAVSQTATTRGVVVSGIMGAFDIAPTLNFMELGLKINGEEWMKVMDEYIAPNCAALMEPGERRFLFTDLGQRAVARLQAGL